MYLDNVTMHDGNIELRANVSAVIIIVCNSTIDISNHYYSEIVVFAGTYISVYICNSEITGQAGLGGGIYMATSQSDSYSSLTIENSVVNATASITLYSHGPGFQFLRICNSFIGNGDIIQVTGRANTSVHTNNSKLTPGPWSPNGIYITCYLLDDSDSSRSIGEL